MGRRSPDFERFKQDGRAAALVSSGTLTYSTLGPLAREYGVSESALRQWIRRLRPREELADIETLLRTGRLANHRGWAVKHLSAEERRRRGIQSQETRKLRALGIFSRRCVYREDPDPEDTRQAERLATMAGTAMTFAECGAAPDRETLTAPEA